MQLEIIGSYRKSKEISLRSARASSALSNAAALRCRVRANATSRAICARRSASVCVRARASTTLGLRALLALVRDAAEAAAGERAAFDSALRRELAARVARALPAE